jgi:adenylate/guanylate cyclase family protein
VPCTRRAGASRARGPRLAELPPAAERIPSLANLGERGHCQLYDLSFGLELDKAVEATFRPPRPVRDVDGGPYCISGLARTPHVVTQAVLPALSEVALPVPRRNGRLRLFVRGGATASLEVRHDEPAIANAEAGEHVSPATLVVLPGGTLAVRSTLPVETHLKLERSEWIQSRRHRHHGQRPARLPSPLLRRSARLGLALKVGRMAPLFSDLSASTALYGRAGDAPAFRLVRDSFDVLRAAIEHNGGTVVKTIGDAIMAAFTSDEDAVRAAVAMQRAFPDFIRQYHYAQDVRPETGRLLRTLLRGDRERRPRLLRPDGQHRCAPAVPSRGRRSDPSRAVGRFRRGGRLARGHARHPTLHCNGQRHRRYAPSRPRARGGRGPNCRAARCRVVTSDGTAISRAGKHAVACNEWIANSFHTSIIWQFEPF